MSRRRGRAAAALAPYVDFELTTIAVVKTAERNRQGYTVWAALFH